MLRAEAKEGGALGPGVGTSHGGGGGGDAAARAEASRAHSDLGAALARRGDLVGAEKALRKVRAARRALRNGV